jgi:conjugative transposon TraN protein
MKCLLIIWFGIVCLTVNGQSYIKPRNLQVTDNKTTNIIFPAQISSIDRGSERIVVQKSTGNILRVKADTVFSDTTNLSVITNDGKLYSFLISYASSPEILNLDLGAGAPVNKDTALLAIANTVLEMKNNLYGLRFSSGQVKLSIAGIYTTSEVLVCKLRIENNSSLSFEIGRLYFHVKVSNTGKRRPVQETEITPLLVQSTTIVRERQSQILMVVLPKVALGAKQVLQIDCQEKGDERHLTLRLPNKHILKAALLK